MYAAVNKSQDFLLNVRRLFIFFSTTTQDGKRLDFDDDSIFSSTTSYST